MSYSQPEADAIRAEDREAILRLARNVAGKAARAAGYQDAAEVSENFITMVLTEAIAARNQELQQQGDRAGRPDSHLQDHRQDDV